MDGNTTVIRTAIRIVIRNRESNSAQEVLGVCLDNIPFPSVRYRLQAAVAKSREVNLMITKF